MSERETKEQRNARVQDRYDELMGEGKHGHYETLFRVVREEIDRAAQITPQAGEAEPVAWMNEGASMAMTRKVKELLEKSGAKRQRDIAYTIPLYTAPPRAVNPKWTGCNECDESFPCFNGEGRCIRLPHAPPDSPGAPADLKARIWSIWHMIADRNERRSGISFQNIIDAYNNPKMPPDSPGNTEES